MRKIVPILVGKSTSDTIFEMTYALLTRPITFFMLHSIKIDRIWRIKGIIHEQFFVVACRY
jgi:hypothetical protein